MGAELFRADRRTDTDMTKRTVAFFFAILRTRQRMLRKLTSVLHLPTPRKAVFDRGPVRFRVAEEGFFSEYYHCFQVIKPPMVGDRVLFITRGGGSKKSFSAHRPNWLKLAIGPTHLPSHWVLEFFLGGGVKRPKHDVEPPHLRLEQPFVFT